MGWLIALAGICIFACIPLGFRAVYRENNPGVFVLIGPFKVRVYPTGTKRDRSGKTKKEVHQKAPVNKKNRTGEGYFPGWELSGLSSDCADNCGVFGAFSQKNPHQSSGTESDSGWR